MGELVKEKSLHSGFDEEWQSYIVDEDKVHCYLALALAAQIFSLFMTLVQGGRRNRATDRKGWADS